MDKEQLSQYKALQAEIKYLEKKIQTLNTEVVTDMVQSSNHEYPYQAMNLTIQGVDVSEDTKRLKQRLYSRKAMCNQCLHEIVDYIDGIPNSEVRLIFSMRYIDGKTWFSISKSLGKYEESYARKVHDRYLEKNSLK